VGLQEAGTMAELLSEPLQDSEGGCDSLGADDSLGAEDSLGADDSLGAEDSLGPDDSLEPLQDSEGGCDSLGADDSEGGCDSLGPDDSLEPLDGGALELLSHGVPYDTNSHCSVSPIHRAQPVEPDGIVYSRIPSVSWMVNS